MTRLDMADYLGLTIETVSRILTRLAGRGIITPAGRHEITVLRPTTLAALAVVRFGLTLSLGPEWDSNANRAEPVVRIVQDLRLDLVTCRPCHTGLLAAALISTAPRTCTLSRSTTLRNSRMLPGHE